MAKRTLSKRNPTDNEVTFTSLDEARAFERRLMFSGVSYKTNISKTRKSGLRYIVTVFDLTHSLDDPNCWCDPIVDAKKNIIIHRATFH
jgi:hypothetical protein